MKKYVAFVDLLTKHSPQHPASVAALDLDGKRAIVGLFKGNIYLYSIPSRKYKLLYKPTSIYNWATASLTRGDHALVGTKGDGLIAIGLGTGRVRRFPDDERFDSFIRALATYDDEVYIGAKGLFKARLQDFIR